LIEVKHLTKKYGSNVAVCDVSFTVGEGHVYGFLGPNGAGKSTTMNIICGCLAATEGTVLVDGVDIYEEPMASRKKIGYLPEIPPLYKDMTPSEYLRFIARAKKVPDVNKEVKRVCELTSIVDVKDRLIRNLSKGYRQRVGIAQALVGDPEIIVLDEPTVGLDPVQIIEIRDLIRSLGKDHTVILSSHILSEISATCDHVIIIAHGKIVANDTLENLNRVIGGKEIITVEGSSDPDKMIKCLSGIDGIGNIDSSSTPAGTTLEIEVAEGRDIRESVFRAFANANLPIVRLSSNSMTLEQIFLNLINEEHIAESDTTVSYVAPAAKAAPFEEIAADSPYYERKPKDKKNTPVDEEYSEYSTLFGEDVNGKEDKQ
jgi:ABC-2 type transport system ATP-binding protein